MSSIILESKDGERFSVDLAIAKMSNTIKTMLEDLGETKDDEVVPLPNVSGPILKKVIDWATYHKNDAPYEEPDDEAEAKERRSDDISTWDKDYLDVDQQMLYEIILASNYLDIKPLLDTCCKTVANMIKGKTAEEIRKTFNIKSDFSPEEQEAIKKEEELSKAK